MAKVVIENKTKQDSSFVPYKENFVYKIKADDSIELDTLTAEEELYYKKVAEDLGVKSFVSGAADLDLALTHGGLVTVTANMTASNYFATNKNTVLNLNGKTLKLPDDNDKIVGNIVVTAGELTLENGAIEAESYVANVKGADAKLIIRSGDYYSNSASVVQVSEGNCEIYGGTFRISDSAEAQWGTKYLLNVLDKKKGSAKITVYGGTFYGFNPAEDNKQEVEVAEGYKVVKSGTAYTVIKDAE